ncbi:hypothetical protein T265_02552 [Opisthorchis viverrini]|uniref:Uncharacterized protein n=1 Tax=Opisthorchis viverrini TaxID=6198 RepID=A0A075A652_OPIVI|nr:hypothetical protein T265_02552 [Opisthorchis viverrini]KER31095.1 hypothetical protein T265_02552 [Opisthorchis viverrini]
MGSREEEAGFETRSFRKIRRTLEGFKNPGTRTADDKNPVNLECVDKIVLNQKNAQTCSHLTRRLQSKERHSKLLSALRALEVILVPVRNCCCNGLNRYQVPAYVRFLSIPRNGHANLTSSNNHSSTVSVLAKSTTFCCKPYCTGSEHVGEARRNVKRAMLAALSAVYPTSRPQDYWILSRSLVLIDTRKSITVGREDDGARKCLKPQVVKSLEKDRDP